MRVVNGKKFGNRAERDVEPKTEQSEVNCGT